MNESSITTSAARILIVRGGAIGDFILTLPAVALLRESFPAARLEILGYPHIAGIAVAAGLADAVRPLETAALARFFGDPRKTPTLDANWEAYFASFNLIVSHLFDPDGFFAANLRRAGVKRLVEGAAKIDPEGAHATRQLARGLKSLALHLEAPAVTLRLDTGERIDDGRTLVALHPGSGSPRKNWPVDRWLSVAGTLLEADPGRRLLLVGGEADGEALDCLTRGLPPGRIEVACGLPLPELGSRLARCGLFLGHDSGVSHLAAASGCPCLLLFGPTDPDVWAPPHPGVRVLRAPGGDLVALDVVTVRQAAAAALAGGPWPGQNPA